MKMKNILKNVLVIIGTVIGAGFASGQEIYLFFNKYGQMGIFGIIISSFLTGTIIYKTFQIIKSKNIKTYAQFLEALSLNKKLNKIVQIMIQAFLLVSFYIMVAGFAAYFKQEFNVLIFMPAIIMAILCYITFINDTKGIVYINTILVPFLCIFICYLGIKNINFSLNYLENTQNNYYKYGWLFSSILYASYNSILLIPILIELANYTNMKKITKKVSICCGSILAILGGILFLLLARGSNYIYSLELPLIEITKQFSNVHSIVYGGIILIAIFTTAISSGYGFLKNLPKTKYKKAIVIICASSILVAPIGFSRLVSILYPIFGVLGIIQVVALFVKSNL